MLPLNHVQGKETFGIFAMKDIPQNTTLWENGPFDRNHSTVCGLLGVQVEDREGQRKRGKKGIRRHILSFLHQEGFQNKSDMGSEANATMLWCDLAANSSPTLFVNSINPDDDKVIANVFFTQTKVAGSEMWMSLTKTTRDIAAGEEILSTYLCESEPADEGYQPQKKRQRTKK